MDLTGTWSIHLGEDPPWGKLGNKDKSSWETIILPGSISKYSLEKTGRCIGTAWLRKTIFIPMDWANQDLGLSLGRISHADETFFNGEKIGSEGNFPPHDMSMWNISRHYFISNHMIRPGFENVITVRVWFHTYGDVSGDLSLLDVPSWEKDRTKGLFVRIILNYIIIAMGIPLLLLFFLFYIQRPQSTEYLYYGIQLLCGFFIIFDLCSLWRFPGGIDVRFKIVAFSWIAINVAHPLFLHRLYDLKRKKIEWFLVAYLVISFPLFLIAKPADFREYGFLVVFVSGSIGFYNLSCHFSALFLKKPYSILFSIFGLTVVAGAIHDGLIYLSKLSYFKLSFLGYTFDNMLFPIGAAALYIGTAIVLVYRFIELLKTNEDLNENLENKVTERTRSMILITEELERQNIKLEEMAIRDSLTGLYNHAAFFDRLDEIFMTSRKNKAPMAVAMIDVDDFKGFNDTYGHQVGDQVLMKISGILKTCIREYDIAAKYQGHRMEDNRDYDLAGRYGGDEFMMVLPCCYKDLAITVTERVCLKISQISLDSHPGVRVSGSFGVAVLNPDISCPNSEKLVTLADLALYKSKSMGKNRVCCKIYEDR
ncbi:MAG: diguanylate cyclase [Proteobacteria bacterium]|nr:diguanylate cyclase [Pseudomonadota bacterium]